MQDNGKKTLLKYQTVKKEIMRMINDGLLDDSKCLPPENTLCDMIKASRMTVRKAVDELVAEDILYRIQGKGTFIKQNVRINQRLSRLTSFSEDVRAMGMVPDSKILLNQEMPASELIAEKLGLKFGDPVIQFQRLRLADNEPIAIETSYYSSNQYKDMLTNFYSGSLYQLFKENYGIKPARALQTMEISKLTNWEANLLGEESSIALFIHRQTFDQNDRPFEYVVSRYRIDKYKFNIELFNYEEHM